MSRVLAVIAMTAIGSIFAEEQVLSITQITDNDPLTLSAKKVIFSAYGRIGIKAKFVKLPGERALALTNQGITDGELFRVAGLTHKYPNLIQVPYPYVDSKDVVFVKSKKFQVNGWGSLKPYRIAVMVGYKLAENNTRGFNVFFVDTPDQGFQMLNMERVDIMISKLIIGQSYVDKLGFKEIEVLLPPLQQTLMYHYLNSKHKELVPKIKAALQQELANH